MDHETTLLHAQVHFYPNGQKYVSIGHFVRQRLQLRR